MKLINITKGLNEKIWKTKNGDYHIDDGAGLENCNLCRENICKIINGNNKYNRHFYLYDNWCSVEKFAEKTNHIICKWCDDFCNQECFLLKNKKN